MDGKEISQSVEKLELINSLFWFIMDAFWMYGYSKISLILSLFTIISGLAICFVEKRKSYRLTHLAVFSWILMNTFWLASEFFNDPKLLIVSKISMFAGMVLLFLAYKYSQKNINFVYPFRRLRMFK